MIILKDITYDMDQSEGQVQQTGNFKMPPSPQVTTLPKVYCDHRTFRPTKKHEQNECMYIQGRSAPSVSPFQNQINVRTITKYRGCYCVLCPDQSNLIVKLTPSTNHSGIQEKRLHSTATIIPSCSRSVITYEWMLVAL